MIHHELFGQHLRLGNFLFKYAASEALCKKHNCKVIYPDYYLWKYLATPPQIYDSPEVYIDEMIRPRKWEWTQEEQDWVDLFSQDFKERNMQFSLDFFFQSAKWFEGYDKAVYNSLKIKQEEIEKVKEKYSYLFDSSEYCPTIGISIRLGDFVNNQTFHQIPHEWYVKALKEFPYWREERNVVVFSDDIEQAKKIFKDYPFYYAEPNNTHTHAEGFKHYHSEKAVEQFILGTLMDDWIIGNPTFSWWIAWLATYNKPWSKVIHCGKVFNPKGNFGHCDTSNYYHPSWIKVEI
jgi:hypothetical protein